MSAETAGLTIVLKWLWAPVVAITGWLVRDKLKTLETDNKVLERKVHDLRQDLDKNYYDKQEIREHIVEPLQQGISEIRTEVKSLTGMVHEMHQDMTILKFKLLDDELRKQ